MPLGLSECPVSWIDRSYHLLIILQVLASAQNGCSKLLPVSGQSLCGDCGLGAIIFRAIRAVLLASATAASFGDLRLSSAVSQGDALPLRRACWITEVAPTTSTLRNVSSPARVITPSLTLPAVE
jgi:hypothetical protein